MTSMSVRAVPRALVWAGLAALSLYIGIRLVAGPGRDIEFRVLTWTASTIVGTLALTAVLAGLFARAAWLTWRNEVMPAATGAVHLSGAPLGLIGDAFLSIVGGILLAACVYMLIHVPESLLASSSEQFRSYASASATPSIVFSLVFAACGVPLLVVRRYVWELRAGQPIRRSFARAFSGGKPISRDIRLYWTLFYEKRFGQRVPVARWLRAEDVARHGFYKDAHLELVPLDAPHEQLSALTRSWHARFMQLAGAHHAIGVDPVERPGAIV